MDRVGVERDRFGLEVKYEYIEIIQTDDDTATLTYFQNGEKQFVNVVGRGSVFVKRRKWKWK